MQKAPCYEVGGIFACSTLETTTHISANLVVAMPCRSPWQSPLNPAGKHATGGTNGQDAETSQHNSNASCGCLESCAVVGRRRYGAQWLRRMDGPYADTLWGRRKRIANSCRPDRAGH
jgi:hypothetical protein